MISIEKQSRVYKCWISGAMNANRSARMWRTLSELLEECDELEINLSRVGWLDIDGFQWMRQLDEQAANRNKIVRFVSGATQRQGVMNLYHFFCGLCDSQLE